MILVEVEVNLPDDLQAFVRSEVQCGRYAYEDEVIAAAVCLFIEEHAAKGLAEPLSRPSGLILSELRHAIAAKRREGPPEILDIGQDVDRWAEIMARVEAGEPFVIARDGMPKARLEPLTGSGENP